MGLPAEVKKEIAMKQFVYTSDIWGSEPFSADSLEDFQADINDMFEAAGDWGDAPEVRWNNSDELDIFENGEWIVVGEVIEVGE